MALRTWKMRKVTDRNKEIITHPEGSWTRLFFVMDCGHRRQYGIIVYGRVIIEEYGPGVHNVGDRARCYECARKENHAKEAI